MEKVIKIGKQSVKLSNNFSWVMEYRDQFGKDVIQEHLPMLASLIEAVAGAIDTNGVTMADVISSLEGRTIEVIAPMLQTDFTSIIINTTWSMAKAADENILPPKQWIKQFDVFPLDVVVPSVYELALKGMASSKNLKRLMTLAKTIQPSQSTPLSSQDLKED